MKEVPFMAGIIVLSRPSRGPGDHYVVTVTLFIFCLRDRGAQGTDLGAVLPESGPLDEVNCFVLGYHRTRLQ